MQPRSTQTAPDLTVLLMSREPALLRESFAVVEAARDTGFAARVIEVAPGQPDTAIVERIRGLGSKATAIGVTADTLERCVGASEILMENDEAPVLLFGRALATESERRRVPSTAATAVVVGPAPPTVLEFLRSRVNGAGRVIAGLDLLDGDLRPRPPRGAFEGPTFPRFGDADLVRLRRVGLPIRMSYGCTRRCVFCLDQRREGGFRARTAEDVLAEMQYHREHNNVRRFRFCDLALNGDLLLLDRLCSLLLDHERGDLQWWGRALVDGQMPRGLYRKMRVAGCIGLDLDVVTASDAMLRRMAAGFTSAEAGDAVQRASAAGITPRVSLIVGLPGEAEVEFGETCEWLHRHRYDIAQIKDITPCTVREGTLLWRHHADHEVCLPEHDPETDWHDGGFNTRGHRMKKARELRVFVEDGLHLDVVGQAPEVPWSDELREKVAARLLGAGQRAILSTGRFRQENLELAGILQREGALAGPPNLEIDLTNNCNQHCVGCWVHSYMMGEDRLTGEMRRATLDYDRLARLIRDARAMGTRRIQLSGAGEPFMHPRIDDVLTLIKDLGFELNVITNFTLVDEERARRMVDLGVDSVTVSLWAGTGETYARTHPTARHDLFAQVVRVISHLTWYRRRTGARSPRIKIYNVISNLNHHEIHEMIDVAREVGADLIEFTPIDTIAGRTDSLALSEEDGVAVLDQLMALRQRPDYLQRTAEEVEHGRIPGVEEQSEFARFLQQHRLPGDFRFSLGDIRCWETYCRRGIHCSRVYEEIQRDSAIFFGYPASECHRCMAFVDCSIDPVTLTVRAPYVSLQGFGSFWRRVRGGGRDANIVDRVPCSIGYTYARVQATGHVIPCCKAASFPLGNIMEQSFGEVWRSEAYDEFRSKALELPKSDPYFAPMECYKVCDNLGHNMAAQEAVEGLSPEARAVLVGGPGRRP